MEPFDDSRLLYRLQALARSEAFDCARDRDWADDLLQSKLLRLWEKAGAEGLRKMAAIPYARRVVRRAAIDAIRRERAVRWVPLESLAPQGRSDGALDREDVRLDEISHPGLVSRNQVELDEEERQECVRALARREAAVGRRQRLARLRPEHADAWRAREKERILKKFGEEGISLYEELTGVSLGEHVGTKAMAEAIGRSAGLVASWAHRAQEKLDKAPLFAPA